MVNPASLVFALLLFVIAQRILDRMHLTDRVAVIALLGVFVGTMIDVAITGFISVNIGGAIIIGLAVYVIIRADTAFERIRGIAAAALAAFVLYFYPVLLRVTEPGLDLLYWHGPIAGAVAYALGRSRRAAFSGGVLSVFVLDGINLLSAWRQNILGPTVIGGAGAFDAMALAGITAALLAEGVGELTERLARNKPGGDSS